MAKLNFENISSLEHLINISDFIIEGIFVITYIVFLIHGPTFYENSDL